MTEVLNQFNFIAAFSDIVIKSFFLLTFSFFLLRLIPSSASKLRYQLLLLTVGVLLLLPFQTLAPHLDINLSPFSKDFRTQIQPAYMKSLDPLPVLMEKPPISRLPSLSSSMAASSSLPLWLIITVVCWSLIGLALSLKNSRELFLWRKWILTHQHIGLKEWEKIKLEVAETLGMYRYPLIITSQAVDSPLTFGWRRPLVVLPTSALSWSEDRIRLVLLHEGVHIKRRDYLFSKLVQGALAFYWFNPLAWLMAQQVKLECERSCDEHVVRSGISRTAYAGELLAIANQQTATVPSNKPTGGLAVAQHSLLFQRFQTLLSEHPTKIPAAFPFKTGIIGVAIIFFLFQLETPLPYLFSTEQALIRQIKKGESQQTQQLLMALVDRDAKKASEEILSLLNSESPALRAMAAWALGELRTEKAVYPLTRQIADQSDEVKEYVLLSLAEFGYSNTFYTIIPLLQHPKPEVRKAALWALSQIGCLPAFYHTSLHLADADSSVRQLASALLKQWNRDKLFNWMSANLLGPKVPPLCTNSLNGVIQLGKVDKLAECLAPNRTNLQEELKSILNQQLSHSRLEQLKTVFSKL